MIYLKKMKKTKQETPIKTWYEHLSITHNWIRVDIIVDYVNMQVSLVDQNRNKKNWVFCERGFTYENWWNNILDAMKEAMKIWFDKLREREEIYHKELADKMILLNNE
jgi:hypothetical protein